ncbi:kynureninase [Roseinatronobacter sp. S2]|uniref:kynureninase n=1 Tax=Roseinatronobacter sp. S2 TaxID=3035471 RepID=UPI00240EE6AD|nr:kynureninase [Roseinatronobacter sp. S2]WFE74377.1 kynureninase [Roseinatronobacter sp. S2]
MTDFAATRAMFDLPEGVIYLDGNSLGPLPRAVATRVGRAITDEWGQMVITGWNRAGWMDLPARVGDRVGRLIGAPAGSVIMGDTLSIKVYQALASALELRADRRVILSDTGNFPSDLYMADGLCRTLGPDYRLKTVPPEVVESAIDDTIAVLMITEVDYRTGRKHDMARLIAKAHEHGALVVWDLAHSAGAIPVDVAGADTDFAVGCSYKYLNSGPGGPAFIYVAPRLVGKVQPALSGWLGHEAPFAFDLEYRPGPGIERMRVGTPPILQLVALDAALDVWDGVDMNDLRARSLELQQIFIDRVAAGAPELRLASPVDGHARGSQVSFHHEDGYAIIQALIAEGVIGDFRAPDILRFGFTPLYLTPQDVTKAADTLCAIIQHRRWDQPEFKTRSKVT